MDWCEFIAIVYIWSMGLAFFWLVKKISEIKQ